MPCNGFEQFLACFGSVSERIVSDSFRDVLIFSVLAIFSLVSIVIIVVLPTPDRKEFNSFSLRPGAEVKIYLHVFFFT